MSSDGYTLYPPVPQTIWSADDLTSTGPGIDLGPGLYGVEFQLAATRDATDTADHVALAQVTTDGGTRVLCEAAVSVGEIDQRFSGMYGGTRLNLILDEPMRGIDFRLTSIENRAFQFIGCKLIPRPGRLWFTEELARNSDHWTSGPERRGICTQPTLLRGPYVDLPPDSYRVGVKLMAPDDIEIGLIAELAVIGVPVGADKPETLVDATPVTAESVRAKFGIPDSKMRFQIDQPYRDVEIRVKTHVPGVMVQWVRLATADEATWHHYFNMGGRDSALAYPLGPFVPAPASRYGLTGFMRPFKHGVIYYTTQNGPCEVFGDGQAQFDARGGLQGELGYPVSRPRLNADSLVQDFEGGSLFWEAD